MWRRALALGVVLALASLLPPVHELSAAAEAIFDSSFELVVGRRHTGFAWDTEIPDSLGELSRVRRSVSRRTIYI